MLINCKILCGNDGMNHILKHIKNICTAQENPVSDLRWLDTVFKNSGVQHLTCSNYAFLGFIQQVLGFLYILITLLSNYISFSNR